MMSLLKSQSCPKEERERRAAIADAERAAEIAAAIADVSTTWSMRSKLGEDDAAEAIRAAQRARQAAERAEHAPSVVDAAVEARSAWAAAATAAEADARVVGAIVDELIAA